MSKSAKLNSRVTVVESPFFPALEAVLAVVSEEIEVVPER